MLAFCPSKNDLINPWIDGGINRCFAATLSGTICLCIITVPAIGQLVYYAKHALPVEATIRSKSYLYTIQIIFHLLIPFLSLLQALSFVFLQTAAENSWGFVLLQCLCYPICWLFAILLLICERNRHLPSIPSRSHGLILLTFWTVSFVLFHFPLISLNSDAWWWKLKTNGDQTEVVLWTLNYACHLCVFILGIKAPGLPDYSRLYSRLDAESNVNDSAMLGGFRAAPERGSSFVSRLRFYKYRISLIMPFIWPKGSILLQLRVLTCVGLLISGRIINIVTPVLYKHIVDSLTPQLSNSTALPNTNESQQAYLEKFFFKLVPMLVGPTGLIYRWDLVVWFVVLKGLQGMASSGSGIVGCLRSQLWLAVDQFSTRELSVKLFSHLHDMSMQWHLGRKTGEVLRVVDRGTSSISQILNYLLFQIAPTIIDILIGVVFFISAFNLWYATLLFITMALYTGVTISITEWRTKFRRVMNTEDNKKQATAVDSLLNFETVKYYNNQDFEVGRYRDSIFKYQQAEWKSITSLNFLNTSQNLIILFGMLIGLLLCARDVVLGRLTVGDYVLFQTYMAQLYGPLNFFGTYYRILQGYFIDMEKMFDLMEVTAEVTDIPDAGELLVPNGEIEFRNVCFHYSPERPILKNISFKIPAGCTFALVGDSGSGKSTIVRLLFRLYDVVSGEILIDGQNIANVQQKSLRKFIGVVPQDTVLFNDTIGYNIRYARPSASENEVHQAALAAGIHNRICEFPQGYDTVVGERGLKLSGGEKQRVAIARTLLKAPSIVLLDEATSALDSTTERNIQASLQSMLAGRSGIIIAHRLSTVRTADQLLVMQAGEIIERGSHNELLQNKPNGHYAELWNNQSKHPDDDGDEILLNTDATNSNSIKKQNMRNSKDEDILIKGSTVPAKENTKEDQDPIKA